MTDPFLRSVLLAVLTASIWLSAAASNALATSSPCDSIVGDPGAPGIPGEPDIIGQVTVGVNAAGGATVELYRCDGATPTLADTTSTTQNGTYQFLDLDGPEWYFVQAVMTGPLAGLTPSSGTLNPTPVIEVGEGATGVNLAFE